MQAEARTITHMQKMYKGLENKIISLQQKIDEFAKENQLLRKKNADIPELQRKLEAKKSIEDKMVKMQDTISTLELRISSLLTEIDVERDEKMAAVDEKARDANLMENKLKEILNENKQLQEQVEQLTEAATQKAAEQSHRSHLISEAEQNEIHQAYQTIVKEKEQLEQDNFMLTEEVNRLIKYAPIISKVMHSRSVSNVSSVNLEDDFGYASAKNTLELKRSKVKDRDNNNGTNQSESKSPQMLPEINQSAESYEHFSELKNVLISNCVFFANALY